MSGRVEGLTAVVTGAGSGIGAATAALLAEEGAAVVVADIAADAGEGVAAAIRDKGGVALAVATDMGEPAQVEALITRAVDEFGGIDVLHNNAAAMNLTRSDPELTGVDLDVWNRQLAVNVTGPMLAARAAVPHMLRAGGGSIIHTASVEAVRASEARTGYSTTKAALLGLSRSIAVQYGPQGIRSNALLPGPTISDEARARIGPEAQAMFADYVMAPATSEPRDQAHVVLFLASPESWFVNGQEIVVDGGFTSYLPFVPALRRQASAPRT